MTQVTILGITMFTQSLVAAIFAIGAITVMVLGYNIPRARTILFAIGFFTLTSAFFTDYSNWLPQVRGEVPIQITVDPADMANWPTEKLAEFGEKIIFGRVVGGAPTDGDVGKGQCPLCHTVNGSVRRDRGPNMKAGEEPNMPEPIGRRGELRMKDPTFKNPKNDQTESAPGSGRPTTDQEYIAESHVCPSCYVVPGYGEKGTNDTKSPMPKIHKNPIALSIEELIAVDTYLYVKDDLEPPSFDEIKASYEKFIPKDEIITFAPPKEGGGGDPCAVDAEKKIACPGDTPEVIFTKMGCPACHKIPSIEFAKIGAIGPMLMEGENAPHRIKSPEYKKAMQAGLASARTPKEYVMESIMSPSAFIVPGFEVLAPKSPEFPLGKSPMPHDFADKFTFTALSHVADFLLKQNIETARASGVDRMPLEKEGSILKGS